MCLMWLIPSVRVTILEHITAAHVQCTWVALDVARSSTILNSSPRHRQSHHLGTHAHALLDMCQKFYLSKIPHHKHIEHDRLKDTCTGCGNVYNTEDDMLHHMCKHHMTPVFSLCLVWIATSIRIIHGVWRRRNTRK